MASRSILVFGVGTIGFPLITFFLKQKEKLGLGNILFTKKTANKIAAPMVDDLVSDGAIFCVPEDQFSVFQQAGMNPKVSLHSALTEAAVIIDCTQKGVARKNKTDLFPDYENTTLGFIAQGSETGFGIPMAYSITDYVLPKDGQYIQIVSCNTHQVASLTHTIALNMGKLNPDNLVEGDFVLARRDVDISQGDKAAIASPSMGIHDDENHGSHQAADAINLFKVNFGYDLDLFSSPMKLNQQIMHATRFRITVKEDITKKEVIARLEKNRLIALTGYTSMNNVFSRFRDRGHCGRSLNQSVVIEDSVMVRKTKIGTSVYGFALTPQDGNSIMSTVAAVCFFLDPDGYQGTVSQFLHRPFVHQRI